MLCFAIFIRLCDYQINVCCSFVLVAVYNTTEKNLRISKEIQN